jgi:hypothetical protein
MYDAQVYVLNNFWGETLMSRNWLGLGCKVVRFAEIYDIFLSRKIRCFHSTVTLLSFLVSTGSVMGSLPLSLSLVYKYYNVIVCRLRCDISYTPS